MERYLWQFIEGRGMMRVGEYAALTGLSRSAASREIQTLLHDPSGTFTTYGRGTQRVIVLRRDEVEGSEG